MYKNTLFIGLLAWLSWSFTDWQPDFTTARQAARQKHRLILLNFSGSDWCGPCMRMHKELFADSGFIHMADTTLVLFNADFPRNKKNQLLPARQQENEQLADRYNARGSFPFTVLLDADGKVLKTWDGLPRTTAAAFSEEIKNISNAWKQQHPAGI
jgi:thioredoxin-related protein